MVYNILIDDIVLINDSISNGNYIKYNKKSGIVTKVNYNKVQIEFKNRMKLV